MVQKNKLCAVLDANVLYPSYVRDALLSLAAAELFVPVWSVLILEETFRNRRPPKGRMDEAQEAHLRGRLYASFESAVVPESHWEQRLHECYNERHDRHVTTVALAADAHVIVTFNLRHFKPLPPGIVAESPDTRPALR